MKEILSIAKKIKNNETLTECERNILFEAVTEQKKCIEYYSQNFVGSWNSDDVNINWRAAKCIKHINDKKQEIKEVVIIDIEKNDAK